VSAVPAAPARVRVTVADAWQVFTLDVTPAENAASLKARALASARIDPSEAARYEVKVGLGLRNGASVVVLASRRRPVR